MPNHIIIKLLNIKDKIKILKVAKIYLSIGEKLWMTQISPQNLWMCEGSSTTYFWVLKANSCQPKIIYPVKLSFRCEEEIKTFLDKLREFVASRSTWKKAKGYSLNRKEIIKEGNLKHQEGSKNMVSINMGKYDSFPFFSWVF